MKLRDHVLKEHRVFRVRKDGKVYTVRIVDTQDPSPYFRFFANILKKSYGINKRFIMDIWSMYFLRRSRRYMFGVGREAYGFDTFEDCIKFLRDSGFKIIHPRHK